MTQMVEIKTFIVGALETNCYLVFNKTEKIGFLIDPGSFDRGIVSAIKKEQLSIKNVINTHGHIDHTAGNKFFDYPVLIHELDSDFLQDPSKSLSFFTGMLSSDLPPPERLLHHGDIIEGGRIKFEVIHTPGHTPGSISLKLGNKIFTGDTLFREGIGRTDFPYANEKELIWSIKNRLMIFEDNIEILPGHGMRSTIGHERNNNPFLE